MVDPAALTAIRGIGEATDVVLHTNATTRLPADLVALGLQDCFAAVVNSASVGVAKPEPTAFEAVLEITGQPPEKLVFVDDSKVNVSAAQALGLEAHLFEGAEYWPRLLALFE